MNNKTLLALIIFSITNILDATPLPIPEINYEKFTLNNGLTVVVHEDRKVPMVAVNIWYHVGSKNENVGKTGFRSFI
jgi:predicted Zn-dependent peptidase